MTGTSPELHNRQDSQDGDMSNGATGSGSNRLEDSWHASVEGRNVRRARTALLLLLTCAVGLLAAVTFTQITRYSDRRADRLGELRSAEVAMDNTIDRVLRAREDLVDVEADSKLASNESDRTAAANQVGAFRAKLDAESKANDEAKIAYEQARARYSDVAGNPVAAVVSRMAPFYLGLGAVVLAGLLVYRLYRNEKLRDLRTASR